MDLDLRRVRYFVATAEEGQITRAARRLHLTQPALTESLHVLERQIGTPLFVRHPGGVELSAAGHQFLPRALALTLAADDAVAAAQEIAGRSGGTLRIGVHGKAWRQVRLTLDAFRTARPDVTIFERTLDLTTQEYALEHGQVDLVFNVGVPEDGMFSVQTLSREPRLLAVPSDHRYADQPRLTVGDLLDEPFVSLHPAVPRWCQRLFSLASERAGGRLGSDEAGSAEEVLSTVVRGGGLFTAPAETARAATIPGLMWREVDGLAPVPLVLVTDPRNRHPDVAVLAGVAAQLSKLEMSGPLTNASWPPAPAGHHRRP